MEAREFIVRLVAIIKVKCAVEHAITETDYNQKPCFLVVCLQSEPRLISMFHATFKKYNVCLNPDNARTWALYFEIEYLNAIPLDEKNQILDFFQDKLAIPELKTSDENQPNRNKVSQVVIAKDKEVVKNCGKFAELPKELCPEIVKFLTNKELKTLSLTGKYGRLLAYERVANIDFYFVFYNSYRYFNYFNQNLQFDFDRLATHLSNIQFDYLRAYSTIASAFQGVTDYSWYKFHGDFAFVSVRLTLHDLKHAYLTKEYNKNTPFLMFTNKVNFPMEALNFVELNDRQFKPIYHYNEQFKPTLEVQDAIKIKLSTSSPAREAKKDDNTPQSLEAKLQLNDESYCHFLLRCLATLCKVAGFLILFSAAVGLAYGLSGLAGAGVPVLILSHAATTAISSGVLAIGAGAWVKHRFFPSISNIPDAEKPVISPNP